MRDHPEPGPPWVPVLLRGMLTEFDRELRSEAFADLQFRLPPLPTGGTARPVRLEAAGGSAPRFTHPLLTRSGSPPHPSGFGPGARPRETGHP